jgi:hypothetical protein
LLTITLLVSLGCAKDNADSTGPETTGAVADCEGCHTSKDMLITSAAPDTTTPPENPGAG